jgi:hypothetical protein
MKKQFKQYQVSPSRSTDRQTKYIPSLTTPGGSTALKDIPEYTGTEMIGIAIIHKSCLQPVFSKEAATDTAQMRR